MNVDAFESIVALLIYGIVLFPNIDNFVDMNAIQIFLTQNPVPTLLADDTFLSIHDCTNKGHGVIICCTPLLQTWFTSHLPRPKFRPEKLLWSKKIMALTLANIVWFNPVLDPKVIIDRCGEFNNVPLLGIRGGINYNPDLARRQFGYPMKMSHLYLFLDSEFFFYKKDGANKRAQFVKAWHSIIKMDKNHLGRNSNTAQEAYIQWVINRADKLKMLYPLQRFVTSTTPTIPLPLPPKTQEESQEREAMLIRVNAAWQEKYQEVVRENDVIMGLLEQRTWELHKKEHKIIELVSVIQEKDAVLNQDPTRRKKQRAFFASSCSYSDDPSPSRV